MSTPGSSVHDVYLPSGRALHPHRADNTCVKFLVSSTCVCSVQTNGTMLVLQSIRLNIDVGMAQNLQWAIRPDRDQLHLSATSLMCTFMRSIWLAFCKVHTTFRVERAMQALR